MPTKSGKATVTIEDHIIPGAFDGASASFPVEAHTIEAAVKSFEWTPGYVGFQFAKAVTAKVTLDDGSEEVTLSKVTPERTVYRFAKKVLSLDEFATAAEYRPAYEQAKRTAPHLLDGKSVIYGRDTKSIAPINSIKFLPDYDQKDTVLISKQGQQLWPKN